MSRPCRDTPAHQGEQARAAATGAAGRFVAVVPEAERFWSKVDRSGPLPRRRPELGACWLWLGRPNASGYGTFRRTLTPGRHAMVLAHRYAYELEVGPIPAGLTLDHLCERPACVRPGHLEPVTAAENVRRRHARQRDRNGTP